MAEEEPWLAAKRFYNPCRCSLCLAARRTIDVDLSPQAQPCTCRVTSTCLVKKYPTGRRNEGWKHTGTGHVEDEQLEACHLLAARLHNRAVEVLW